MNLSLTLQMRNAEAREKRAKQNLTVIIQHLDTVCNINEQQKQELEKFDHIPISLFSKPHTNYSEEQRRFAITLHLYSRKAYDYVRESLPLPHPRTLQR